MDGFLVHHLFNFNLINIAIFTGDLRTCLWRGGSGQGLDDDPEKLRRSPCSVAHPYQPRGTS